MGKPKIWFIIKERKNGLEHPQPEAAALVQTQKNHQIFPASTGAIPKYLHLRTAVPAALSHHTTITADTIQLPEEIFAVKLLIPLFLGALRLGAAPAGAPASQHCQQWAGRFGRSEEPRSLSKMLRASRVPLQVRHCRDCTPRHAAVTLRPSHTCPCTHAPGRGEDSVSMQLVMGMQADGKHPRGQGKPHLAQRPPSPRPHERFSIRLRGNTFFTSFDTSCPSGVWRQQPWVPCTLGADGCLSPIPAPLRGVGRAGTSPSALQSVPWVSLSPSLVGAVVHMDLGQHRDTSGHLQACRHLTCLPGPIATSPASTLPHVGCFSVRSQPELYRTGCHRAAGILGDAAVKRTSCPT